MKVVFASRTGNVESIVDQLDVEATRIVDGSEVINDDYILFTYTDGYGDIPMEVEDFLAANSSHMKGVIVSGDTGYGDAYCQAGDKIADQYDVDVLYKVENAGEPKDIEAIKNIIEKA